MPGLKKGPFSSRRNRRRQYPGAGRGFNNDADPVRYNKAAADEVWKRVLAWFNKDVHE